ncbi:MAG: nuclear transport factor 2 family protein [Chitinophagaceae bacterium]|jgi:ketosteroid isomerase-like protein|nr:nuclear transport factor 2 family protein [Chitinophagaceae bacterium]
MKKIWLLCCIIPCLLAAQSKDETAIRKILADQTNAWNRGAIPDFMKGYWVNDSLLFVGKNGPTYGYQQTLSNYLKSYPDTAAMGKLQFTLLQLRPLSSDYYFVLGKWHLTRTIGNVQGHFTLLFRKLKGNWVIVADHSS